MIGVAEPQPSLVHRSPERPRRVGLLWRVFMTNALVVVVAGVLLVVTPVTISGRITTAELAGLLVALALMLGANLVLLRRVLLPLNQLTELMTAVDPDHPGRRLRDLEASDPDVAALADAFNSMLDRLEGERRESARLALAAQEGERLRVARDLHDGIGQTLTAVTLQADRAADGPPAAMPGALSSVADSVRASLDDVRRIARELRPEALDDLGLGNALIALAERLSRDADLHVERHIAPLPEALPSELELVVYRVAQEALTNVVRHARARNATLSLETIDGRLLLEVRDDGRGIGDRRGQSSTGIAGMRERALLVGGTLTIQPAAGGGTVVRLEVPLPS
jgi:two-component system, NarL family, sensor histidine kinase UhpB